MHVRPGLVLITGLLALGFVASASAQDEEAPAAWDQARVTAYAQELAKACEELDAALGRLPAQVQPTSQRAYYQAKDDIGMMRTAARGFAAKLADGKGQDEVLPRFKRIQALRRSAEENGRKALIPEEIFSKITPVGTALIKLAPYFR